MKKLFVVFILSVGLAVFTVVTGGPDLGPLTTSFISKAEASEEMLPSAQKEPTSPQKPTQALPEATQKNPAEQQSSPVSASKSHDIEEFRSINRNMIQKKPLVEKVIREMAIESATQVSQTDWDLVETIVAKQDSCFRWYLELIEQPDFQGSKREETLMVSFFSNRYDFVATASLYQEMSH